MFTFFDKEFSMDPDSKKLFKNVFTKKIVYQ